MSIFADVLSFIRRPEPEFFEALALRVFRYQLENVPPYRTYVEALGAAEVKAIDQIPPVSTIAFKYARMESVAEPATAKAATFLTSGTSAGRNTRGRHRVIDPEIYRASAVAHLRRMFYPDRRRIALLTLHPTADRMPESSLSRMISWASEEFATDSVFCAATRDYVDTAAALEFLNDCDRSKQPVAILSTTAGCARLFEKIAAAGRSTALPKGSRLMDTGGAKGQEMPLSNEAVVDRAGRLLGIAPEMVINEYGMTEMCSQLYDATAFNSDRCGPAGMRLKLAPPWLKSFALDPATLRPVADGRPGILAFFDLANVGSVSMVMSEDIGVIEDGGVRIIGRSEAADARGCALAIAEFDSPGAARI
jgi:hypothetical protein